MAQNARMILMALALAAGATAAEAGDMRERHEPLVLNGTLHTGDFDGGVGYGDGGTVIVQGWAYGGGGGGAFARTQGVIAGARASAFAFARASASAHAGGFSHGGGGHGHW